MTLRAPLRTPLLGRRSAEHQQVINNLLLSTLATPAATPTIRFDFQNPVKRSQVQQPDVFPNLLQTTLYVAPSTTPIANPFFPNPAKQKEGMEKHTYVNFTYETVVLGTPFQAYFDGFRQAKRQVQQPHVLPNLLQGALYSTPALPEIRLFDQPNPTKKAKTQQPYTWQNLRLTTLAPSDTTPDQFSGETKSGQAQSATITFSAVTPTGFDAATTIALTGDASGEYKINSGSYTASAGTLNPGDSFTVRHTSSGSYLTNVDSIVTLDGTVTGTYRSTTEGDPTQVGYIRRPFNLNWWKSK